MKTCLDLYGLVGHVVVTVYNVPRLVCLGPERSYSVLHNCFDTTNREEYASKRAYTSLVGLRNDMCNWSTWVFDIGRKTKT